MSAEYRALRIHSALTLVAILFSLNYIISKVAMNAFTPLTFTYLRLVGAALILNTLFRDSTPLSRDDERRLIGFAMLGVVINQSFFLGGLSLTTAHVAAILMTMIPVFTLAAAIALGRERATPLKIGGIALAAAGALMIIGLEGIAGARKSIIGDLLIVGNSLSYSLYLVLSKPMMARISARRVIARMFAYGSVLMLPVAIWPLLHERWSSIGPSSWVALLVVIVGATVAAYLINAWALRHVESSLVATYTYLQPVFTILLAATFLGESIRPSTLLAGAMIVAGVYVSSKL